MTTISILWAVWLLSWIAAAGWTAPSSIRQTAAGRLAHSVFIWAGAALLFVRPGPGTFLSHPLLRSSPILAWTGVALVLVGLGFTWWARVQLGRLWSADVALKAEHVIVRAGPYGLTRHPIYTGILLALLGTALTRDTVAGLAGLGLMFAGFAFKSRQEERLLSSHFGAAYDAYRAEVPALVPGLRIRRGR